ncbi:probable 4-coumarate--CoA ligase 1 [Wyeomyia smithii]|uniref:probable 4-coumarate--CoA ligase 1 n=1 Tax=Wyeomyia smithii TaxID=174621 RepID=UPI0024680C4D|nr:probable 4-coumarate--CoA ligase 1 [Wyeomyia smithii]XP_055523864.1 probable 4-coumarate--CoA ligase 1 [Wyeomyia smithii]XP_055523865.1 probable 4-coumarate--CoA ligase 1 [Wyeomyia smithii]XP_055523866.1 probable 4-coumarate--CoA ligase 1 [Wyeomyia smithii]
MPPPRDVYTFYDPATKVWSGTKTPPLLNPNQSLGELILAVLAKTPDSVTQISADSGARVTCAETRLRTVRVAQNLIALGYGQQDVFTMAVRNGELVAPVVFACFALGIPLNTLDATFKRDDLSFMLEKVKPSVVFCDQETLDEMQESIKMANINPVVFVFGEKVDEFRHVEELMIPTNIEEKFVPIHFEDPSTKLAIIVCSSGTTGRSKGVCLSHALCIANIACMLDCRPTDVLLGFSSLYWLSGVAFLLLGTVSGATRIITRKSFKPSLALDLLERFRVSLAFFPPSAAIAMLKHPRVLKTDFSNLRVLFSGGSMVSADLKQSFEKLVPKANFHVGYGLSEAGGVVTLSDNNIYKNGCTGYLRPTCRAKIVDDLGHALDIGKEGEILVKMEYCFLGYYGNQKATDEMLDKEGWLHTGDIGRFDEDGILFVVDRKKDIIKYNNFQISPSEIETVISTLPGVANVCVVGIPITGNDLVTALVTRSGNGDVSETDVHQVVERELADFKRLRGGVHFIEKIPLTPSGKVLRKVCRDTAIEFFNNCSDTQN